MGKHLKLKIGEIVRKKSGELFGGHGGDPVPALAIEKIGAWASGRYILNGLYVIEQEKLVVIDEEEKKKIDSIWESTSEISTTLKPELNTSCVREDNGEPKQKFSERSYRKALFKHRVRNPEGGYEAYTCAHCGSVHIGKTRETI